MKYKIWHCKIVTYDNGEILGDSYPRRAAIEAVENDGATVITCFSGWGGKLTKAELNSVEMLTIKAKANEILEDLESFNKRKDKLIYLSNLL